VTAKPPRTSHAGAPGPRFGSVAVIVSDRARSVTWYTRKLGLEVTYQSDAQDGHWITVGRKGQNGVIHLCQMREIDPEFPLERGNTGIMILLPGDFESACSALKKSGVRFTNPPTEEPWGVWATIADPDGNELCLMPEQESVRVPKAGRPPGRTGIDPTE
jgi:catechol 2,3-dioxygenase-like lactoylglutathione lyase family enzyme